MKTRLALAAAALLLSTVPGLAWQTVTLPQDPQPQNGFSTTPSGDQNTTDQSFGGFHFSATSNQGFGDQGFGDFATGPGSFDRPYNPSSAGYGTSNAPGSEFFSNGITAPH